MPGATVQIIGRSAWTQSIELLVVMVFLCLLASCTAALKSDGKPGNDLNEHQSRDDTANIVALHSDGALPDVHVEKLVTNNKGAGAGALEGMRNGFLGCAGATHGYSSVAALAFLVCTPFGLVGGGVVGAFNAEPKNVMDVTYTDMVGELKRKRLSAPQDLLAALEKYAALNGIPTKNMQATRHFEGNESSRMHQEARTLLEVQVVRLFFVRANKSSGISDGIGVEARIRVLRLPGRTIIDNYSFTSYPTVESQTFDERSNDSRLEHAYLEVARAAFDESILAYHDEADMFNRRAPANSASRSLPENTSDTPFPDYTLRPIAPQHTNSSLYQRQNNDLGEISVADTLQPEFQWESLPVSFGTDSASKIRNITYEFNLYPGRRFGQGYLPREDRVYIRTGLTLPKHYLESTLVPCTHYFWTVRAHFTLDGQPRVTEWSGAYKSNGAITPSSYRRNRHTLTGTRQWLPIGVFYPEFRTPGECGTSINNTDVPTIRLQK